MVNFKKHSGDRLTEEKEDYSWLDDFNATLENGRPAEEKTIENQEEDSNWMEDFRGAEIPKEKQTVPSMPDGMELTPEFEKAYKILEYTNKCVYLTGNAGSGKTTFLKYWLSHTNKRTVVLSPTGMGAVQLLPIKASTVHRFFGFKPVPLIDANIPRLDMQSREKKEKMYNAIDTIIIDECSMVSSLMLQAIDSFYRFNFDRDEPFGGIQIVLVGDLAQLPPVIGDKNEKLYVEERFGSKYFFDATVLKRTGLEVINLTKIFRQKDELYISFLNKIRKGTINSQELDQLNEILLENKIPSDALILCTVNSAVEFINKKQLEKIDEKTITLRGVVTGNFNLKNCPVEEFIELKKGCKIMCRNNDSEGRWINGTLGTFVGKKGDDAILIEIDGNVYEMGKFTYDQVHYEYDYNTKKLVATKGKNENSFVQFAVSVAYSFSIHKSQGATFQQYKIKLGNGSFDSGQLYVALSRGTNLQGIGLIEPITMRDVIIDKKIGEFYKMADEYNGSIPPTA